MAMFPLFLLNSLILWGALIPSTFAFSTLQLLPWVYRGMHPRTCENSTSFTAFAPPAWSRRWICEKLAPLTVKGLLYSVQFISSIKFLSACRQLQWVCRSCENSTVFDYCLYRGWPRYGNCENLLFWISGKPLRYQCCRTEMSGCSGFRWQMYFKLAAYGCDKYPSAVSLPTTLTSSRVTARIAEPNYCISGSGLIPRQPGCRQSDPPTTITESRWMHGSRAKLYQWQLRCFSGHPESDCRLRELLI